MHRLLHDIPRFLILFLEEFNQMLSIGVFGRHVLKGKKDFAQKRENWIPWQQEI